MREIGGEFSGEFSKNTNILISDMMFGDIKLVLAGRHALDFIIKDILQDKNIVTVLMPDYCCESMIQPFLNNEIRVFFYKVELDRNLCIDLDLFPKIDVVFVMEYFGFSQNIEILNRVEEIIIEDKTHSYCQNNKKNFENDYEMVSLRKWFSMSTAVAAKKKSEFKYDILLSEPIEYLECIEKAKFIKQLYINGDKGVEKKQFLSLYRHAFELLDKMPVNMKAESEKLPLEMDNLIYKRRENARYLIEHIKEFDRELLYFDELNICDVPLFVPIKVPKEHRKEIHNFMIKNQIYLPIHWPKTEIHNSDNPIYDEEISLVCDQRYCIDDMCRMVELIKEAGR